MFSTVGLASIYIDPYRKRAQERERDIYSEICIMSVNYNIYDSINLEFLVVKYDYRRLSIVEFFKLFGLDIENDERVETFWSVNLNDIVIADEKMYDYLGYVGNGYFQKKQHMTKLLKKKCNSRILYKEIGSLYDPGKNYYVLNGQDFQRLMLQMKTPNVLELRHLMASIDVVQRKFREYENHFERLTLTRSLNELKTRIDLKFAEREQNAQLMERRAEQRERHAEQVELNAIERINGLIEQVKRNVTMLNNVIALLRCKDIYAK